MKAWRVHEYGNPEDVLRLDDVPDPEPGPGQVVVRVEGAALNFPDVLLCQGTYQVRPPLPFTPGVELTGTVVRLGVDAPYAVGDRLLGSPGGVGGALCEYAVMGPQQAFPVPAGMPAAEAAGFYLTYQTGWVGLHTRAHLQPGETLLVHAGAGGVGSAAIQLGKAAGATVIATAGGPEKVAVCKELGADLAVDYTAEDFVAAVKDATAGRGADVIYDPVGGDVFDKSRKCVAFEGRIVIVGFTSGRIADAPTNHALVKNYSVVGLHWGLYNARKPQVVQQAHDELTRLYAEGSVRPLVSEVVPLADAPAALARLASRRSVGKLVVTP